VVPLDTLVDAVWGDDPPPTAVASLRTYVSRLRPQLRDTLQTRGSGYQLVVGAGDTDASQFEALVDGADAAPPDQAARLLTEALRLWRGPAFGDEADVEQVRAEARRLDERRNHALEQRARALLEAGRPAEAVAEAEALVATEPLREGAWIVLVEGLARAERAAEALRAYQRAADALADAGLEPSTRLRDSERAVLDGTITRSGPGTPATTPTGSPASRLTDVVAPPFDRPPLPVSSFVGRESDCEQLVDLLDTARVVTLVGPGGVGKTRLALEVVRTAAARGGSTRVVELAPLSAPEDVPATVVAALGLAADQSSSQEALDRAGHLDMLVVLDNAEHVIEETARTIERLVRGGSSIRVLATSRERLGVDGEQVWTVAPLTSTGHFPSGCQLFVDRARAAVSDLDLSPDDDVVARIVRRLDGLPLAIEMAAAQLSATSLDELADALDDHVDALRSPRRDAPERHRSLAAVLAWSEERLDPDEATILAELSVFAGPVSAVDIDGVLGRRDAAAIVRSLATRSLVSVNRTVEPTRFQLLFTVRDFAGRTLAGTEREQALAERHARWFTEVARTADSALRTTGEVEAHRRIDATFAELRAAHRWARTHQPDLAVELSGHLQLYAYTRLTDEPLQWAEALTEQMAADRGGDEIPALLTAAATRALTRGDLARASVLAGRAVELAGASRIGLSALEALSDAALYDGRLDDSLAASEALVTLAAQLGDAYYAGLGRCAVAMATAYSGRAGGERAAIADLDELARRVDLPPSARGWLAYTTGELLAGLDDSAAFHAYDEALALAHTVGNRLLGGVALVSSCSLRARVGEVGLSLASFGEAIRQWEQLADNTHQLTTLRNLAVLLRRADAPEAAAELLGAVERTDVPTYGPEAERLEAVRAWAVDRLGPVAFEQRATAGSTRDIASAAAWARDVIDALRAELARSTSAGIGAEA
jgi:predicted ATPase/DNA-binding SARP family transcriptional activator